jgi:hypothetical protein
MRSGSGNQETRGAVIAEVDQIAGLGLNTDGVIDNIRKKDLACDPAILRVDETG